jgi:hypothetical protein
MQLVVNVLHLRLLIYSTTDVLFHNASENTKLCNITARVRGIITSFRSYYVHLVSFYTYFSASSCN